jgi:hypothetical protein
MQEFIQEQPYFMNTLENIASMIALGHVSNTYDTNAPGESNVINVDGAAPSAGSAPLKRPSGQINSKLEAK